MDKAAALGYSLIRNHGLIDGNKRVAHAAMEVFLIMNGLELRASVDDQERFMHALAAGEVSREALVEWLRAHVTKLSSGN